MADNIEENTPPAAEAGEETPVITGEENAAAEVSAVVEDADGSEVAEASGAEAGEAPDEAAVTSEASTDVPDLAPALRETSSRDAGAIPDLEPQDARVPLKEVADGRAYEIGFIVRAGESADVEAINERVTRLVEDAGGAIDNVRVTEPRRLSYPIRREIEGIYVVLNGRFNKALVPELDRHFKLEENVLRHIVLREEFR